MWRKRTEEGVDIYEGNLRVGLGSLRLTAERDRWTVTAADGAKFIHGYADSYEAAREQAVVATLTMLRDARRRLEQETFGWLDEPV